MNDPNRHRLIAVGRYARLFGTSTPLIRKAAEAHGIHVERIGSTSFGIRYSDLAKLKKAIEAESRKREARERHFSGLYSFVYFIQSKSFVKIGTANAVHLKLQSLQDGNPVELKLLCSVSGDAKLVEALHEHFREHHERGDWFRRDGLLFDITERLSVHANYVDATRDFYIWWSTVRRTEQRYASERTQAE